MITRENLKEVLLMLDTEERRFLDIAESNGFHYAEISLHVFNAGSTTTIDAIYKEYPCNLEERLATGLTVILGISEIFEIMGL